MNIKKIGSVVLAGGLIVAGCKSKMMSLETDAPAEIKDDISGKYLSEGLSINVKTLDEHLVAKTVSKVNDGFFKGSLDDDASLPISVSITSSKSEAGGGITAFNNLISLCTLTIWPACDSKFHSYEIKLHSVVGDHTTKFVILDRSWFGLSPIAALPAPGWADERGDDAEIQQAHIAQIAAHLKSAYSVLSGDYKKFQEGHAQYFAQIQSELIKSYENAKTQDERNNILKRIRGANFDKLSYHSELVPYWREISNQNLLARILTESGTSLSDADRTALAEKFIGGCDEEQALKVLRQGKLDRTLKEKLLSCVKSAKGRIEFVDDKDIGKLAIGGVSAQDMAQYLIQNKNLRNIPNLSSRLTDFVNKIEGKETRNNVLDALLDAWKDAKDDDAKQCRAVIVELAKDDDQVYKVLKNLHHSLIMREWHDLVDRISESATADMAYENLLVDKESARLASDEYSLSELLSKIAKKVSAEKSSEIVKRLQSEKKEETTCSICGLYLGMNALDGLVLAAETKNDVAFSVGYDSGKESTGVSREDIKVQTMYFSVKYLASALQCEDAEVLYCMIHRYVMNKSGKAYGFEYAGLTNVETQRSEHWSLVYGTSYTYTTWQTYTNSKLGVKFWFDEKNGVVKITQI